MACCVPNCDTSYWNKNSKGLTLFTPDTDKRVEDWSKILREKCGLERIGKKIRICILHFGEDVIERELHIVHDGKVRKEPRKRPLLSPFAYPTIFPVKSKKTKAEYCELLGPEILEQQRNIFAAASVHSVNKKYIPVQSKVDIVVTVKRKTVVNVPLEGVKSTKVQELNGNLFEEVVNAIREKRNVSKCLDKCWIPNLHDDEFVSWTLWKKDCSTYLKRIVLHNNLKVDMYLLEKRISLPEMHNISSMCDFEKFLEKVAQITPCMKAEGNLGENECLGFVTTNSEQPKLRCDPCSKLIRNLKRRVCSQYKERKNIIRKTFLVNRCTELHRKKSSLEKKTFGVSNKNISVPHIMDPHRRVWFISDFPHLIECMRNFFTHAGIWIADEIVH